MLKNLLPKNFKETVFLRTFGFFKIPMIFFCSPSIVEMTDQKVVVKIPLTRRTRNHLRSMYFGVLSVGADVSGGLIAMRMIQAEGDKVNLIFKDFHAEFLKRAEGDVHFTSTEGDAIRAVVKRAMESGERENIPVHITATVPSKFGDEPIANFVLTLSLKKKSKAV